MRGASQTAVCARQRVAQRAARQERNLYQPLARTDAGWQTTVRRCPLDGARGREQCSPRPLLPHYHRRAHFVRMK